MNGIKYLFDTNAIISFLQGNSNLSNFTSLSSIGTSIISIIEFLSFAGITELDKKLLFEFINEIEVYGLNKDNIFLINTITSLRSKFKIKLPDAIISGTAIHKNLILVTNDKDFSKIPNLQTLAF